MQYTKTPFSLQHRSLPKTRGQIRDFIIRTAGLKACVMRQVVLRLSAARLRTLFKGYFFIIIICFNAIACISVHRPAADLLADLCGLQRGNQSLKHPSHRGFFLLVTTHNFVN
jgi:hypothetical protein